MAGPAPDADRADCLPPAEEILARGFELATPLERVPDWSRFTGLLEEMLEAGMGEYLLRRIERQIAQTPCAASVRQCASLMDAFEEHRVALIDDLLPHSDRTTAGVRKRVDDVKGVSEVVLHSVLIEGDGVGWTHRLTALTAEVRAKRPALRVVKAPFRSARASQTDLEVNKGGRLTIGAHDLDIAHQALLMQLFLEHFGDRHFDSILRRVFYCDRFAQRAADSLGPLVRMVTLDSCHDEVHRINVELIQTIIDDAGDLMGAGLVLWSRDPVDLAPHPVTFTGSAELACVGDAGVAVSNGQWKELGSFMASLIE